jgi:O-antigen/teichoic acid export membrane protein
MRFGKVAILHFLAQVVRSVAGFAATFFIARYLGAAELGIYSQALALLFWLKLPGNSVSTAVSKRMSERSASEGFLLTGLAIVLGYGFILGGILVILQEYVNSYVGIEVAGILALLIAVNLSSDVITSGLIGIKRVALSGWLGSIEQVFRLLAQIGFVLIGGYYVVGLVLGHLLSLAIFATIGLLFIRERLSLPNLRAVGELRTFAQYSWLGNLKSVALNWMDLLVLGFFVADNLVGIYQASWTLSSFLALASSSIATTLFPELSDLGTEEDYERAQHLIDEAFVFAGVFLIPGIFGAAVIGDRVLRIYRPEFSIGAVILVILITARTFDAFGRQLINALNGLDYPDIAFRINAAFLVVNLSLNLLLVSLIGWYGAAIATLVSSMVFSAVCWRYLTDIIGGFGLPFREIGREILASTVMVAFLVVMIPSMPSGNYATVAVVVFGAAVYATSLLGLSPRIRQKTLSLM